jgi:hypothetical protein
MIEGCPVNGPAISARGDLVAVAWFTGSNDQERINLAFSSDSGASFSRPIQIDDGSPVGRVGVNLSAAGDARVVWLERVGAEGAEVRLKTVRKDGVSIDATVITTTSAARTAGFPRIAAVGDDLVLAWTDPSEGSSVHVARVRPGQ